MCLVRLSILLLSLLVSPPLWADDSLPDPQGPVILKVSGKISHTNVDDEAHFDYAMLAGLGMHEVVTRTPWTEGVPRFEGPLGRALLAAVGAWGARLLVKGLDGYIADVPVSDFLDYEVILAIKRDGERIPIRERGPILILYPFDQRPELLNERIRFRSVWQVAAIEVE